MNVTVAWELPTSRTSNRPLAPSDIRHVVLDVSADGGSTFVPIGEFPPSVLSAAVTDLDFGTWLFRGVVVPVKGLPSLPMTATFVIDDTTPPNPLVTLTVVES